MDIRCRNGFTCATLALSAIFSVASAGEIAPGGNDDPPPPEIIHGTPPGFELVRLTNEPEMWHSIPDINDHGEVVFERFDPATNERDIFLFSEGIFRKITNGDTVDERPVINNQSEIVWSTSPGDDGLFRIESTDESLEIPGEYNFFSSKDINETGDVVWSHFDAVTEIVHVSYFNQETGEVNRLTDFRDNQSTHINNNSQIVWREIDRSVNPWSGRIKFYADGVVRDITPGKCQCQGTDLNDLGHVVWQDAFGVYLWDGERITFSVTNNDLGYASTPRINNNDDVAFALWIVEDQLWRHALLRDGIVYLPENYGFWTARSAINNRGDVVLRNRDPDDGHCSLFMLRRIAPKGDFNHDCMIDLYDFSILQRCGTATPGPEGRLLAECIRGDFDDDGDVDANDWAAFSEAYGGPAVTVNGCLL